MRATVIFLFKKQHTSNTDLHIDKYSILGYDDTGRTQVNTDFIEEFGGFLRTRKAFVSISPLSNLYQVKYNKMFIQFCIDESPCP